MKINHWKQKRKKKRILFLLKTQNKFLPKNPKQNLSLIKTQNKIYSYSKSKAKFPTFKRENL